MATSKKQPNENYKIYTKQVLGMGSFGKVCKASRGGVPCAAKILHPTLFDPTEQHGVCHNTKLISPFERFKQESRLLSELRHPNIIQFLELYKDPCTSLPVILMELMDASLTNYLKERIPYQHIKVDICYDISLALAYLHSKNIIHRDLSSNNILLLIDSQNQALVRTKLADFGMAKLWDLQGLGHTLTQNPGKVEYMPPEALQHKPLYTEKIDCFSFGVTVVQILTQHYPAPGPQRQEIESEEFGGVIEMRIPEVERRKGHISEVDPNDPLLSIALDCLKDKHEERPSAEQICERVLVLKQKDGERQPEELKNSESSDQDQCHGGKGQSKVVLQSDTKNSLVGSGADLKLNWSDGMNAPCEIFRVYNAVVHANTVYIDDPCSSKVYSYSTDSRTWSQLPDRLTTACPSVIVNDLLTTVGGKLKSGDVTNKIFCLTGEGGGRRWNEIFPPMKNSREYSTSVCIGTTLIVAGGMKDDNLMLKQVEVMNTETRQWSTIPDLPQPLCRSLAVICGDLLYLFGGITEKQEVNEHVYQCSIRNLQNRLSRRFSLKRSLWLVSKLSNLPLTSSTYVSLNNDIISIGGKDPSGTPTAVVQVYSHTTNSWKIISDLSTPRSACFAAVLLNSNQLIVVGGRTEKGSTNTVEIADIS